MGNFQINILIKNIAENQASAALAIVREKIEQIDGQEIEITGSCY